MALSQKLSPLLARMISSDFTREFRRNLFNLKLKFKLAKNNVIVFHRIDDPYSYLLIHYLHQNQHKIKIPIVYKTIFHLDEVTNPEPLKASQYALEDAKRLTQHYGFDIAFKRAPNELLSLKTNRLLTHFDNQTHCIDEIHGIYQAIWSNSGQDFDSISEQFPALSPLRCNQNLVENKIQLKKLGHYMSAMLYYGGEWYWGIDRMGYLLARLDPDCQSIYQDILDEKHSIISTPSKHPDHLNNLDCYFSFRSPYSYLAIKKLEDLRKKYPIQVTIKPVLPMVMRGFKVPWSKKSYIVKDCLREARRYGIPFGHIRDPLGDGIQRCIQFFYFAEHKGLSFEYTALISTAIWSQAADVSQDKIFKNILGQLQLSWHEAIEWIAKNPKMEQCHFNRNKLNRLQLWGVPSFDIMGLQFWGQDRLWMIEDIFD